MPARVLGWPVVGGGGGGGEDVGGVAGRRQAAPAPPPRRPRVPPPALGAALVEVILAEAVTLLVSSVSTAFCENAYSKKDQRVALHHKIQSFMITRS